MCVQYLTTGQDSFLPHPYNLPMELTKLC
jgi:hypothetical protein